MTTSSLLLVSLFSCFLFTNGVPLSQQLPKDMVNFMKQYGYLIDAGPDTDALYTEESFKKAIRQMQKYGGLPETGIVDDKTLALMTAPRCGVRDVIKSGDNEHSNRTKRYIIGAEGWKTRTVTYFLANWPPELGPEVTREKMKKAFQVWSEITPLRFINKTSMTADIIIAFGRSEHGDGYPFDGPGNILAHAYFPYEHGSYGGDIHFDDDETWIDASKGEKDDDGINYDFYTVAVHELGHSLGLAHSTVPGSIMFPYYKGYNPNFILDYDDILAMYQMYVVSGFFRDTSDETESTINSVNTVSTPSYSNTVTPPSVTVPPYNTVPISTVPTESSSEYFETEVDYSSTISATNPPRRDERHTTEETAKDEEHEDENHQTISPTEEGKKNDVDNHSNTTNKPRVDGCEGSFDAISLIRNELFIFKGLFMWRLKERGIVPRGYPVYFHYFLYGMPWSVRKIDAVYQRPTDYNIIFFAGKQYWEFNGNKFTEESPHPLSHLGLPETLDSIDAAIVWGKNRRTYLFRGTEYWRYDEMNKTMDPGYPRPISKWRGLPPYLDSAFTWRDGQTYFFKGNEYWRFNNHDIITDMKFPQPAASHWLGC